MHAMALADLGIPLVLWPAVIRTAVLRPSEANALDSQNQDAFQPYRPASHAAIALPSIQLFELAIRIAEPVVEPTPRRSDRSKEHRQRDRPELQIHC